MGGKQGDIVEAKVKDYGLAEEQAKLDKLTATVDKLLENMDQEAARSLLTSLKLRDENGKLKEY